LGSDPRVIIIVADRLAGGGKLRSQKGTFLMLIGTVAYILGSLLLMATSLSLLTGLQTTMLMIISLFCQLELWAPSLGV
jgi:hypothetical protein